ncbi:MAG TPA: hypothetical protein VGG74_14140 [Kofleriaceae bacterium]|jgi:hypothetical protein
MESQFRIGVVVGGIVLVAVITYVRFCGSLSLPAKPPPLQGPQGTQRQLIAATTTSTSAYRDYLERDAAEAGVRAPTIDDMGKKLAYRVDDARHVLEPGKPAIEIAGLRLRAERSADSLVLVIQNLVDSDLGYEVTTEPSTGDSICTSVRALPINAMVIEKGASETRTECAWRDGMSLAVTKVETVEVNPLSSFYLGQVPPALVGIDARIARGNHGVDSKEPCPGVISQVVSSGLQRGDLGWRDLVDFYARHRCQTFQFPISYRAFKSDNERPLPDTR